MSSVVVEESIARVNAQKDQARETKKRHSRIFWTEFCLGFITGTLNAKQERPRERETQKRRTLLIERATAAACGFFFLFLFVRVTNAREFNIYIYIVPGRRRRRSLEREIVFPIHRYGYLDFKI